MKNYQIIILAAGKGTRMNGKDLPKVLYQINGRPMIQYLLDQVEKLDSQTKSVLVVGYKHELVQKELGQDYVYAFQEDQLGTAHAVVTAKSKITGENVLVLYGDCPFITSGSIQKIIDSHRNGILTMFTTRVNNFDGLYSGFRGFGRIFRDADGKIDAIREYIDCTDEERGIKELNPAVYVFNTKWLWENIDKIQSNNKQKEFYLTDLIHIAREQGHEIKTLDIDPREVYGINTKEQLKLAESLLSSQT
jgi:bifunctional UDP-N-acetylglucosamine pyrophosphorylase / glucosamine-1-phosphate N-acetyltransferase